MDLRLYARVLWRFRLVVLLGVIVAVGLALLSVARVSFAGGPKLSYRHPQTWTSTSTIWVTQAGFPLGRSIYDQFVNPGSSASTSGSATVVPVFSDPSRFASLATLYTTLVTSDAVRQLMLRSGPINGAVLASQPTVPGNVNVLLPYVQIAATANSPAAARALVERARAALTKYVLDLQALNQIPQSKRVLLQVLNAAEPPLLTAKRSITRPIVILIATLMIFIGLAFFLENLRPRIPRAESGAVELQPPAAARRSA
jgi:hypothetical protein